MTTKIAVDTGGTFTDVAVSRSGGLPIIGKSLTTKERISDGLLSALDDAARQLDATRSELLQECDVFLYGTTHSTNAIVTQNTAKTALITTAGFEDTLVLREGGKSDPFDFVTKYPKAYVPHELTFGVRERVTVDGEILTSLDETHAIQTIERLVSIGVEAIAVSLLWSIANPQHELRLGELIEQHASNIPYSLAHQVNPVIREYRRASATAIDASLKPLMQSHLTRLANDLRTEGFDGELLVVSSMGGATHLAEMVQQPIYSVKSGPSLAPTAAATYAAVLGGETSLVVCDTGGTTFDVSLVSDGRAHQSRDTWIGDRFLGHMAGVPSVDVESLGAGGGSIAWLDDGGLLRVGPHSAGANPGPACYGSGGTEPTLTDACLVLGYLDADKFLGGRMKLNLAAARQAISPLAASLDSSIEKAAESIYLIATDNMVEAIKQLTIREGIDARESAIVAGGGAAGMNIVPIAEEVGVKTVIVPVTAGGLSAAGGLFSPLVAERSTSKFIGTAAWNEDLAQRTLGDVQALLLEQEHSWDDFRTGDSMYSYRVSARYPDQVWEIEVELNWQPGAPLSKDEVERRFHDEHERLFTVAQRDSTVDILTWTGRIETRVDNLALEPDEHENNAEETPLQLPRHNQADLREGMLLDGPTVIDAPTTTIVVPASFRASVRRNGYLIQKKEEADV